MTVVANAEFAQSYRAHDQTRLRSNLVADTVRDGSPRHSPEQAFPQRVGLWRLRSLGAALWLLLGVEVHLLPHFLGRIWLLSFGQHVHLVLQRFRLLGLGV